MDLRRSKPFALLPAPNWFIQLTFGASHLLNRAASLPHHKHEPSEGMKSDYELALGSLSPSDARGVQSSLKLIETWQQPEFRLPAIVWRNAILSVVDAVALPVLLRAVGSIGKLDAEVNNVESPLAFAQITKNSVMRLGRTVDGLEQRNGAQTTVALTRLLGDTGAKWFSVSVAKDLALKDTLQLAALALTADGCRHVYSSLMWSDSFECQSPREKSHMAQQSVLQSFGAAFWSFALATRCLDTADEQETQAAISEAHRQQLYADLDNVLGEDISRVASYLLSQLERVSLGRSVSQSFDEMYEFESKARLLCWRFIAVIDVELLRLNRIANSSWKRRRKLDVLHVPRLKTSLTQRIYMRNAGDLLNDIMYPMPKL